MVETAIYERKLSLLLHVLQQAVLYEAHTVFRDLVLLFDFTCSPSSQLIPTPLICMNESPKKHEPVGADELATHDPFEHHFFHTPINNRYI